MDVQAWALWLLLVISNFNVAEHSSTDASAWRVSPPINKIAPKVEIQAADLVARRQRARAERDFVAADTLMQQLVGLGLEVVDRADGTTLLNRIPTAAEVQLQLRATAEAARDAQRQKYGQDIEPHTRMRSRRNHRTNANHRVRKVRAQAFASWLVGKFAHFLPHGEVLDVAGGCGSVCWELVMRHGVRTTVVDPRPMRLSEGKTIEALTLALSSSGSGREGGGCKERENEGGRDANSDAKRRLIAHEETRESEEGRASDVLDASCLHPRAVRRSLRRAGESEVGERTGNLAWRDHVHRTCVMLGHKGMAQHACLWDEKLFRPTPEDCENATRAGEAEERQEDSMVAEEEEEDEKEDKAAWRRRGRTTGDRGRAADTLEEEQARAAWERCDVIVGLHPDQATDAIVDAALLARKPFAVVPCCVFPAAFPNRRVRVRLPHVDSTRGSSITLQEEKHEEECTSARATREEALRKNASSVCDEEEDHELSCSDGGDSDHGRRAEDDVSDHGLGSRSNDDGSDRGKMTAEDGDGSDHSGLGREGLVPVRSREELVQYLVQKAPPGQIKLATVPGLPGPCNIVVYVNDYHDPPALVPSTAAASEFKSR